MKSFVLDQKDSEGKTHTRAVLSYAEANRGVTSWLAPPAPMGSLEYISPDANVVAGFVVKDPTALVDDLLGVLNKVSPDLNKKLATLQSDHGLDLRKDFAAPLGGEYAFAIDGPILPVPSWKLVFEVNDPAHLQQAFEHVVDEVNKQMAQEGKAGLLWDRADAGGHTYYTLRSKDLGVEVNYVFANGYLIAGPTRALVEQAQRMVDALEGEAGNALGALGVANRALTALEKADPVAGEWREMLDSAYANLSELTRLATGYAASVQEDPERLAEVEESNGATAVSPITMVMRSAGTPNSCAAIWVNTVRAP